MRKVAILVNNSAISDGRVIKTAECLAASGMEVVVFCVLIAGLKSFEYKNGVLYRRYGRTESTDFGELSDVGDLICSNELFPFPLVEASGVESGLNSLGSNSRGIATERSFFYRAACFLRAKFFLIVLGKPYRKFFFRDKLKALADSIRYRSNRVYSYCRGAQNSVGKNDPPSKIDRLSDLVAKRYLGGLVDYKPDMVYANDLECVYLAEIVGELFETPYVYDIHEFERDSPTAACELEKTRIIAIEDSLIKRASGLVTVSDSIADWHSENSGVARPEVVYNSPLHNFKLEYSGKRVKEKLGISKSSFLAVYTGLVALNRGVEEAISALAGLPRLHLAIVGPNNNEKAYRELISVANKFDVRDRLHFVSPVPHEHVSAFISDADCGLIPAEARTLTQKFGLPNKLFEMIFAGLPVIAVDIFQRKLLLEMHGVGIFVPNNTADALRSAFSELENVESWGERKTLAEIRAISAHELIGWKEQEKTIVSLCERVMSKVELKVGFKGERNYIQGPDLYNAVGLATRKLFKGKAWVENIVFRGFAAGRVSVLLGCPAQEGDKVIASLSVVNEGKKIAGVILDEGDEILQRTPYDESLITDGALIERESIVQNKETPFTPIEDVVALTKAFHNEKLPSSEGKWIFSRLDLDKPLTSEDGLFTIKLLKNLNGKFTVSEISKGSDVLGTIRFAVAKP